MLSGVPLWLVQALKPFSVFSILRKRELAYFETGFLLLPALELEGGLTEDFPEVAFWAREETREWETCFGFARVDGCASSGVGPGRSRGCRCRLCKH